MPDDDHSARGLVLYYSRFGNTARVAQSVAEGFAGQSPARAVSLEEVLPADLPGLSWLILGMPTHYRNVPLEVGYFLDRIPAPALSGVRVAVFDTRYRMPRWLSGSAARRVVRRIRRLGGHLALPPRSFFVVDREGPLAPGEPERALEWGRRAARILLSRVLDG